MDYERMWGHLNPEISDVNDRLISSCTVLERTSVVVEAVQGTHNKRSPVLIEANISQVVC